MRMISQIIVHCSDSGPSTTVADIDSWHKARGWRGIGYHWVIYPDGSAHSGRPEEEVGAHCEGDNLFSIGVCLIGGKDGRNDFTKAQLDKLAEMVVSWKDKFALSNNSVFGHRDRPSGKAQGKTCPNFEVRDLFPRE